MYIHLYVYSNRLNIVYAFLKATVQAQILGVAVKEPQSMLPHIMEAFDDAIAGVR